MRALIFGFAVGLVFAASAQAAPLSPNLASIEFGAGSPVELVAGGCGGGWHHVHWQDRWGHWHWHCVPYVNVYHHWDGTRLEHPYADWWGPTGGFGNLWSDKCIPPGDDPKRRPMKTATDRAVEAIEAAEKIFADEMGATLHLSPAAKMALITTISAAIQAAVAEEMLRLTPAA